MGVKDTYLHPAHNDTLAADKCHMNPTLLLMTDAFSHAGHLSSVEIIASFHL